MSINPNIKGKSMSLKNSPNKIDDDEIEFRDQAIIKNISNYQPLKQRACKLILNILLH